jgi:hypothetical protein
MLLQCQQDGFLAVIDAIDQGERSLIFLKEENGKAEVRAASVFSSGF